MWNTTIYRAYNEHGMWSGSMGKQPIGSITQVIVQFEKLTRLQVRDYDFACLTGELSLYLEDAKVILVLREYKA